jgi:hypothetical protein
MKPHKLKATMMKFAAAALVLTQSALGHASSIAVSDGNYNCVHDETGEAIADLRLSAYSDTATVVALSDIFHGLYKYSMGACPSRLCGSQQLQVMVRRRSAWVGEVNAIHGVFTITGRPASFSGRIDLYQLGGRAPEHIGVRCSLQQT